MRVIWQCLGVKVTKIRLLAEGLEATFNHIRSVGRLFAQKAPGFMSGLAEARAQFGDFASVVELI